MELNKSNWRKLYLGGLENSKAADLSLSVIWILSNFLYLNSLAFKISRFFMGEHQSCLSRVGQNNPLQVNVLTVPFTVTLVPFYIKAQLEAYVTLPDECQIPKDWTKRLAIATRKALWVECKRRGKISLGLHLHLPDLFACAMLDQWGYKAENTVMNGSLGSFNLGGCFWSGRNVKTKLCGSK